MAKWITAEHKTDPKKRYPASYFKNSFSLTTCEKDPYFLTITCHGVYVLYVNGERVGNTVLEPGPGNYNDRLEYRTYDLQKYLHAGDNEVLVVIGDGWYRGCNGIDGLRNLFGRDTSLYCFLKHKEELLLESDETWQASQEGPIRFNDTEQGEVYDARMESIGGWHPVYVLSFPHANLVPAIGEPITRKEHFKGTIFQTPNGETVVDFGQNLAGFTHMTFDAHEGDRIILWHGETLDEQGNFTQENYAPSERNREGGIPQKIEYICKEGRNEYEPSFSIFGFRYVKIETTIPLKHAKFESVAVYSDMKQVGTFSCSNEKLNRLFLNSLWSMKSNFCGIPTDCPTRERAGWTGDVGVFIHTGLLLMDCKNVILKWLFECAISQSPNGIMANIAPKNNASGIITKLIQGSAGWGDAAVIVPMALYNTYGEKAALESSYPMMKKWVDFVTRRAHKSKLQNLFKKNPYKSYIVDTGVHFGEWCEPDIDSVTAMRTNFAKGSPELATAYFYLSSKLLSQAASILEKNEDAEYYKALSEKVRLAWRSVALQEGAIHSERQADYVRALAFGLLDEEEIPRAAAELNKLVCGAGYHLNTGFLSTPYLLETLADHGYLDTAYRLLLQESCPSWLYEIQKGATTIWECWDGIREDGTVCDSLNHYSYGAVSKWLISGICGIHYSKDDITIAPQPAPYLKHAEAIYESPCGKISSSWRYDDAGQVHYQIEIPSGRTATLRLPDGTTEELSSGIHTRPMEISTQTI